MGSVDVRACLRINFYLISVYWALHAIENLLINDLFFDFNTPRIIWSPDRWSLFTSKSAFFSQDLVWHRKRQSFLRIISHIHKKDLRIYSWQISGTNRTIQSYHKRSCLNIGLPFSWRPGNRLSISVIQKSLAERFKCEKKKIKNLAFGLWSMLQWLSF